MWKFGRSTSVHARAATTYYQVELQYYYPFRLPLQPVLYIKQGGMSSQLFDGGDWDLAKKRKVKMGPPGRDKNVKQEEYVD